MTHRIYYTDPTCHRFEATVQRLTDHEGHTAIVLDRTAFYPTSGGQPYDTGHLGDTPVIDVVDAGDDILHVLAPTPGVAGPHAGDKVLGLIDWARRFDHMQQHTGQHMLSAVFERLFEARTISFHLGAGNATIDLSSEVTPAQIAQAELEVNAMVFDDRPVSVHFASAEEAATLGLRKEPARSGRLRIVDIVGVDLSACGGTHVARSGAVGLIVVIAWERFKGGSRLTFVCGGRALGALQRYRDAMTGATRLLSATADEVPAAIERVQQEAKDLRRSLKHFQEAAAAHEGRALAEAAPVVGGRRVAVAALPAWDTNGLKAIASAATAGDDVVAALFSTSVPAVAVIATSKNVSVDADAVLKELVARFGGRGGGKPDLAQGGGFTASTADLLAAARELLSAES